MFTHTYIYIPDAAASTISGSAHILTLRLISLKSKWPAAKAMRYADVGTGCLHLNTPLGSVPVK